MILYFGPRLWRKVIVYSPSSRVILVWKLGLRLVRLATMSSILSGEESPVKNSVISFPKAGAVSRPIRASASSSHASSMLLRNDMGTSAIPNSRVFLSHLKCRLRIELMSALTDVPSSSASSLRERANDSEILIVLRTVLRLSTSGFDKRIALDGKDCRPVLRYCLSGLC